MRLPKTICLKNQHLFSYGNFLWARAKCCY